VTAALPALVAAVAAALSVRAAETPPSPTVATVATPAVRAKGHGLVVAANPYAARAGLAVLKRGGTAVDAAVAIQATLGLVEPQSSGVGGGGFLMVYDARTRRITAYNGRETAPMTAGPDLWLGPDGKPLSFREAVLSGRATGVPGAVAALEMAHRRFGRLRWRGLFGSSAALAERGFIVSPRLAHFFTYGDLIPELGAPDVQAYFKTPSGAWVKAGDRLKNPAYAATLRAIARQGSAVLYTGPISRAILARTHEGSLPGQLTPADLAAYRPIASAPLCRPYRAYLVCTPQPPSSGVGLLEQLAILSHTDIDTRGPSDPRAWEEFAESARLMYADRDKYVGDPAFVKVPVEGLLDPAYDAARAVLIGPRAGPAPQAGDPPGAPNRSGDKTLEPGGTSHFVVVDRWGDVVSMTTTVESIFGTGRMVDGFFLNNQLTDFSFSPKDQQGAPAANAPGPGKRPRSSMSPLILLDHNGRFVGALGSPGGNQILEYDAKTLVGLLDWNLSMQQAINLPNLTARGQSVTGETDKFAPGVLDGLKALGVEVKPGVAEESGLHGVILRKGRFDAGADPRREGVVLTD
jgi:gamma-glutamyltranspeptidase/glutathione hydrolase